MCFYKQCFCWTSSYGIKKYILKTTKDKLTHVSVSCLCNECICVRLCVFNVSITLTFRVCIFFLNLWNKHFWSHSFLVSVTFDYNLLIAFVIFELFAVWSPFVKVCVQCCCYCCHPSITYKNNLWYMCFFFEKILKYCR